MRDKLIYLASPYACTDQNATAAYRKSKEIARYYEAVEAAGALMKAGRVVYSPIVHMHVIAEHCELPGDWDFYERFDRVMVRQCDELWILATDGWRESKGVRAEAALAVRLFKPVGLFYVTDMRVERIGAEQILQTFGKSE